jgi:hypothetical protein
MAAGKIFFCALHEIRAVDHAALDRHRSAATGNRNDPAGCPTAGAAIGRTAVIHGAPADAAPPLTRFLHAGGAAASPLRPAAPGD